MTSNKTDRSPAERGEPVRQRVLDGAERLLRRGNAEFTMRDLAAEAGVSFATPFNQFGSKAAIMHALSERRIDAMAARFTQARQPESAAARIRLAVDTAVAVMLEEPDVNRAVMGSIGAAGPARSDAFTRSASFWALALDGGRGIDEPLRARATTDLPQQLAIAFRGVLSFWTAGELSDDDLGSMSRSIANTLTVALTEQHSPLKS